jgi:hypothetical protein
MMSRRLRLGLGLGCAVAGIGLALYAIRPIPQVSPVGALEFSGPDNVRFMITNTGNTTMRAPEVVCSNNKTVFSGGYTLITPHLQIKSARPLRDVEPGGSFLVECFQLWSVFLSRDTREGFFMLGEMTREKPGAILRFGIEGQRLRPKDRKIKYEWMDLQQHRLSPRTGADLSVLVNYRPSLIPWRSTSTLHLVGQSVGGHLEWRTGSETDTIPDGSLKLTLEGFRIPRSEY